MPTRTPTTKSPSTARFSRSGAPASKPAGRRAATPARRPSRMSRRKPEPSGMEKVMGTLGGLLGGGKASKAKGGNAKKGAAGLAVAAGAAGLAMKNRDKIKAKLPGRGNDAPPLQGSMPETPPTVVTNADRGSAAPVADPDRPPT
jgi:hypothetical protein